MPGPKTNTFVSTIRCDARDLAMVHEMLTAQGYTLTSIASIVSSAVGLLADMAVTRQVVKKIKHTVDAIEYLEQQGIVNLLAGQRRNFRTLIDALTDEDKAQDQIVQPSRDKTPTDGEFDPGAFAAELKRRQEEEKYGNS